MQFFSPKETTYRTLAQILLSHFLDGSNFGHFLFSCQVIIKINSWIQGKNTNILQKVCFQNEFFVNKKIFSLWVKYINVTRNITETLSKYILNIWEAYVHFSGTFMKPTLEIFFGKNVLTKNKKKGKFWELK